MRTKSTLYALLLAGLASASTVAAFAARSEETPLSVDETRTALEEYVEVRRVLSQERRDWALGKELLQDRIALVQDEIDAFRTRIFEAEEQITKADEKRSELIEAKELARSATLVLEDRIAGLEARVLALLARLPEPIKQRVAPLSQSFPRAGEETEASLAVRFQTVVGVLNEVNKFQREVTVTSELRTLEDGSSAEVTALYVGVSQGYYVNALKTAAGHGKGTESGWIWTPDDSIAEQVASAIAILKNEQGAAFVPLPVQID